MRIIQSVKYVTDNYFCSTPAKNVEVLLENETEVAYKANCKQIINGIFLTH